MPPKLGPIYRTIINRLVSPPKDGEKTKFWPREMKFAKELWAKIPDQSFWEKVELPYKLNSLAGAKLPHVVALIEDKYKQFGYVPPKQEEKVEVSAEKFGLDTHNTVSKPRFLKDFLK